MRVFGYLYSDKINTLVELGIATSIKEQNEYINEYADVFGSDFGACTEYISQTEYAAERKKAITKLMSALVVNF